MSQTSKLYLMLHEERDYGQLIGGPDPISTVEGHYAEMDAYCAPPPDADIHEEFTVTLYEIPPALEELVQDRFEELDAEEFPREVAAFLAENPEMQAIVLNVLYTAAEGAKVTMMPSLPDLFHRADQR